MKTQKTICFLLLPKVHLMAVSGPSHVFYEASQLGTFSYKLFYAGVRDHAPTEQGLMLSGLLNIQNVQLEAGDFIVVPGIDFKSFTKGEMNDDIKIVKPWLKRNLDAGVNIATI